jgi:hypothetical protein
MPPELAKKSILVALASFVVLSLPLLAMYDRRLPSDGFYIQKLTAGANYDVVFVGDSRCLHGIDPAHIVGFRSYNFSFKGMGLQDEALDRAANLIDPKSRQNAIVITLSRPNLSDQHQEDNEYETYSNTTLIEKKNLQLFGGFSKYLHLNPDPRDIGGRNGKVIERPGGFAAAVGIVDGDSTTTIGARPGKNPSSHVSDKVIAQVCDWIRARKAEGFRIYTLRIPTSQTKFETESTLQGFGESKIRSRMESAGAIWIDTPPFRDDLHSYDGSHLDQESAERFSDELSASLSKDLKT